MRRIYPHIYLHLVGAVLVAAIAGTWVSAFGWRGEYRRRFSERMTELAAAQAADYINNPNTRDAFVRRLAHQLDLDVTLRAPDGHVLAAAGPALPRLSPDDLREIQDGPAVLHAEGRLFAAGLVHAEGDRTTLGFIEAEIRRPPPGPRLAQTLLAVLAVLASLALIAIPLARRISRPIESLTHATQHFGAGALDYRIPVPETHGQPGDELTELARSWNDMAERIARLIRGQKDLLANVSHELRTPLTRIRLALELLPEPARKEAHLREVETDLAELEQLVDSVLTTSRLDAMGLPLAATTVDASEILREAVVRSAAPTAAVDAPEGLSLEGDAALLRRAITNLLDNAVKYGAPPFVASAMRDGEQVVLSVSDRGPGIPAADRARVLVPFFRSGSARSNTKPTGFGLGLTLVDSIARAHGGQVRISAVDVVNGDERGCRVSLVLPLRRGTAA